jgi:hypothetical protein
VDGVGQELLGLGDEAGQGVEADGGVTEPVGGAEPGELVDGLCVPKTCATWAYALQLAVGLVPRLAPGGQVPPWRGVR